jgi:hypothetical protein
MIRIQIGTFSRLMLRYVKIHDAQQSEGSQQWMTGKAVQMAPKQNITT